MCKLPYLSLMQLTVFGTFELEKGTMLEKMVEPLEALGYRFNAHDHNSGLNAISIANEVVSVGGAIHDVKV